MNEDALGMLSTQADGDARRALTVLEAAADHTPDAGTITLAIRSPHAELCAAGNQLRANWIPEGEHFTRFTHGCPALKHTRFPPTCAFTAHGAQRTWNAPAAETAPPAISNTETETASNNTAGRRAMPLSIGP